MNSKVQLKNTALRLRENGESYSEIKKELSLSKGTLSKWLKGISLSEAQKRELKNRSKDKILRGRLQSSIALRARRISKEKNVFDVAEREFKSLSKNAMFVAGVSLYWARGARKNHFQFISSDPNMIFIMNNWIKKYLGVEENIIKYRLFIYDSYKNNDIEQYWGRIMGVSHNKFQKTIYKPVAHNMKKNPEYKGSLSIIITRIEVLRRVIAWQKLLITYYGRVLR